ncbi:hypothetical protein [Paracoccus sp. 22332]|uniref:hypothetical protein n=1 Tax=Paracoccus sp. 22332 TaxID=3453913 RepID=UPI003F84824E
MAEHPVITIIDDLLQRVEACELYCNQHGLQDASERDHPYLASHMLEHGEMSQLDTIVRQLCQRIRQSPPDDMEWMSHFSQLIDYKERRGHYPRTSMEAWSNMKFQLRKTKAFVRILLAEQAYQVELAAAKIPVRKEVNMGHFIQGVKGHVIVDSTVNKSTLTTTIQVLESRFDADVAEFIKSLADFVSKSGNKDAVELVDQLNEELSRPEPRASLMRRSWDNLVAILPVVKEMAGATGALAKLFA